MEGEGRVEGWKGGRMEGGSVACLNADRIWACTPQIADDTEGAADAEIVACVRFIV